MFSAGCVLVCTGMAMKRWWVFVELLFHLRRLILCYAFVRLNRAFQSKCHAIALFEAHFKVAFCAFDKLKPVLTAFKISRQMPFSLRLWLCLCNSFERTLIKLKYHDFVIIIRIMITRARTYILPSEAISSKKRSKQSHTHTHTARKRDRRRHCYRKHNPTYCFDNVPPFALDRRIKCVNKRDSCC